MPTRKPIEAPDYTVPERPEVVRLEDLLPPPGRYKQLTPDLKYALSITGALSELSFVVAVGERGIGTFQSSHTEYWCLRPRFVDAVTHAGEGATLTFSGARLGDGAAFREDLASLGYDEMRMSTEALWMPLQNSPSPAFYGRGLHGIVGVLLQITRVKSTATGWTGSIVWYQSGALAADYVLGEGTSTLKFGPPPNLPKGTRWFAAVVEPKL